MALHRCSDMQFAELGVTADQFVLLATLARGQALTQRELAARMPSDPSMRCLAFSGQSNSLFSEEKDGQSDGYVDQTQGCQH